MNFGFLKKEQSDISFKKKLLNLHFKPNWRKIFKLTFPRKIFLYYFLFILTGTVLLVVPISWKSGHSVSFINALFDSSSAFSDTGLSNYSSTFDTYNYFGQAVIFILILSGGIGINALKVTLFLFIGRKLGLNEKLFIGYEKGINKVSGTYKIITTSIFVIIFFEIIFGFAFGFYFHFSNNIFNEINGYVHSHKGSSYIDPQLLHNSFGLSLWYGFFQTNSAINNAGFDILGSNSLEPFYSDYFIQFSFIFLIIIGGIGFPIFFEIREKIRCYRKGEKFYFSLFTKLCVVTYFSLMFVSVGLIALFEAVIPFNAGLHGGVPIFKNPNYTPFQKFMFIFFSETSARSAGFSTINMQNFGQCSKLVLLLNMWIGASPCSTGGGIRTTTLAIVCIAIWTMVTGKGETHVFHRTLPRELITKSTAVFVSGIILVFIGTFILMSSLNVINAQYPDYDYTFLDAWFECSSAFGTTGLSTGLSSSGNLNVISKITLIILMIVGQLTISGTLLLWTNKNNVINKIHFPYEEVAIG